MSGKNQKRTLRAATIFLVGFASLVFLCNSAQASSITPDKVVNLVNADRTAQNLPELVMNGSLAKAAGEKLADMLKNDYFEHTSPSGLTPWYWLEKNNYDYKYAGENLAMNFVNAEDQDKAWMASPTHRDNILNTHYQEIGVAVGAGAINGRQTIVAVQEFGSRANFVPVQPKQKPEPQTAPPKQKTLNDGQPQVLADNSVPNLGRYVTDLENKFVQNNWGTYATAAAIAGIGYVTILNFIILLYLTITLRLSFFQPGKYQTLYTVSPEEYEDLARSFKARAKGMYKIDFGKIHLKMS